MYQASQPLTPEHYLKYSSCGNINLDDWLQHKALKNEKGHRSRTYVVTFGPTQVVAYYSLAAGSVNHVITPGKVARNAPNPVPVIVLGRLAVDQRHQGQRIGQSLIKQAFLSTLAAAEK